MKHLWIETERGMLIVARKEYLQKDGMPAWDDTILGGVDTSNNYSMGWAFLATTKRELILRHSSSVAQNDVERYLIFKGILPNDFSRNAHEKTV
ncbi:hypothetical protein P1X15_07320 [Runella sp. MFBS21]|uniref:hypothetical protein n=1 Tax=Runella sp. MFBS21 TaxID=3034018 RepID=UPI0023F66267|nr:hypothetical protein [Runella sp. MFBS21]MDF7817397.1 hypothetical protein [Runella sp. MFBS21]